MVASVYLSKKGDSRKNSVGNGEWRQWPLRISVDRLTNRVNRPYAGFILVLNSFFGFNLFEVLGFFFP